VGIWEGVRIGGVGRVALFMQTTPGLILCVVLPLLLLIGYDILRRRIYEKKNGKDVDALMAELEALKAAKAAEETKAEPAEAPTEKPKTEE
jgi:signal peptidase